MLLSLANELKVLPTDLNRLLIIVVVLSMALTPFLAEAGKRFAESTATEEGSSGARTLPLALYKYSTSMYQNVSSHSTRERCCPVTSV